VLKPTMIIIVVGDFHAEFQQLASVDTDTGEFRERRPQLREDSERPYRELAGRGFQVRVGIEASAHARWLERVIQNCRTLGRTAAEIRTKRVSKQKTDRHDPNCC
jgi:transposase